MRNKSSTTKRLLRLIAAISVMTLCTVPPASALLPTPGGTTFLPTISKEVLTPASQTPQIWTNTAPNALASYYTYVPFASQDAVLLGFPATCGNPIGATNPYSVAGVAPVADTNSTMDCYIISARQFGQPMSLEFLKNPAILNANLFPGNGLLDANGLPFFDPNTLTGTLTTAWGYGSGGTGWNPFYQPAGPGGVPAAVPGPTVVGNAPTVFRTTPFNATFGPGNNGDPAAKGIWHFPAPTIKGTKNRPVLVQWMNDLPNVEPVNLDPAGDCGTVAKNCYPYNRIVTHVHGAHVGPESDGLAISWYTPNFALSGEGKFPDGSYLYKTAAGHPIYYYPMTQDAGTIWYHDHGVGSTHNNTNMGLAGFFPITDTQEKCLQGIPNATLCPTASTLTKVLPTGDAFELGFALQDRHFDVNGQMVMPDAAIYDKNDPNCVFDINNNAIPGTCARLQFAKVLDAPSATIPIPAVKKVPMTSPEGIAATTPGDPSYSLNYPAGCKVDLTNTFEGFAGVDPSTGLKIPFTQCAPFPGISSTLEYFGNMPVVNGVTYAKYDVDPTVYRMRFIGGTDSRTWIAQLVKQGALPSMMNCGGGTAPAGCAVYNAADIVPFFQVGSEQGLLTSMVQRNELDIMGGERFDVLVDFTGLGGTTVTMKNLGDDAPFSGRFDFDNIATRMPTSIDIPEIMQFKVRPANLVTPVTSGVPAPVNGAPLNPAYATLNPTATKVVALIEITDQYGRTMPTIDARGYIPPGIRTTEVVNVNTVEQWDIVNTTVDAHPMHLHQVAFQMINRQAVDTVAGFKAGANYTVLTNRATGVFSEAQYIVAPGSVPIPAAPYEQGWKDTAPAYPGYVTRVKALFDLVGDYVWHCHILSHEEHDMMRPFRVTNAGSLPTPATVTVGAVTAGSVPVTVATVASNSLDVQYVVQYRKVGAPFWETNNGGGTAVQTVSLLATGPGTYEFRAQAVDPALQVVNVNSYANSAWRAGTGTAVFAVNITTASALPGYTVGPGIYSAVIQATGGTAPYTFTLTAGALPPGIILVANGQLYGQSNTPGTYNFTVTVTTAAPVNTFSKAFTLVVAPAATVPFAITTAGALPDYTVGPGVYSQLISSANGTAPYTYTLTAGALPVGINLLANGQVYGQTTTPGAYTFTVTATAANAATTSKVFTMNVLANLNITTASPLTNGTLGVLYSNVIAAAGGTAPYTYVLASGAIPPGVGFLSNGQLYGVPIAKGTYTFTVTVIDAAASSFNKSFTLVVL